MPDLYAGPGAALGDYIRGAAPECARQRTCQFSQAAGLLAAARQMVTEGRLENMSTALWCDQGGHAFSERDPGRQRISITVLDDATGEERAEARDFCGDCAKAAGLLQKRRTRPGPLADQGPAAYDPRRTADLERQLGVGDGS